MGCIQAGLGRVTRKRRTSAAVDADSTAEARRRRADEPVSLHPLTFGEALGGLLAVDPRDAEDAEARDDNGA